MNLPKNDPDLADALSSREDTGGALYSLEEFTAQIRKLNRKVARLNNAIRLASSLSTEPKVKAVLQEALSNDEKSPG